MMQLQDYLLKVYNEIPIDVANTNAAVVKQNPKAPLQIVIYKGKMGDNVALGTITVPRNKVRTAGEFNYLQMADLKQLLSSVVAKGLITKEQVDQFFIDYKDTSELKFNNSIIELDLQKSQDGKSMLKMTS